MENLASDYSKLMKFNNLKKEIEPLSANVEEMLVRLDEFYSLLKSVKTDNKQILESDMLSIIEFKSQFQTLCDRIDNLEKFVNVVNDNVNKLEISLDTAEQELGVTDYSLKGFLRKPIFNKARSSPTEEKDQKSNLNELGEFIRPEVFKTEDYFTSNTTGLKVDEKEDS
ncbi:hypothetical protein ACFFRR_011424 [Megaselia abdita]